MTTLPLRTTRRWSNVIDLDATPTEEIRTLKLRRHQIAPKGDLSRVNPVTHPTPGLITKETPVGTIGSCFSARIQDWLTDYGYNFVRTERDPDLPDSWACQTARFGVVYNTGCCRQVFESAVGRFAPEERWWARRDGTLQDPYRAGVTWQSESLMIADLERHAACVREAVRRCSVFIVTPGLAEVWKNKSDGATFAAAPPREVFDPDRHAFTLTSVEENIANLEGMYSAMRELNPGIRVVMAMSPVPLTATFRDAHWVVGNTVSKATLRVAVDRFCAAHPEVIYFPSYEIVTTLTSEAFERDNIHVRNELVGRIMTTFMRAHGDLDLPEHAHAAPADADTSPAGAPAVVTRTSGPASGVRAEMTGPGFPEPLYRAESGGECSMRCAYLREVWKRLALAYADTPIALYGAGQHTRFLSALVAGLDTGPPVAFVLDDHATPGERIGGWEVRRPGEADPSTVGAVVVSTDSATQTLAACARRWSDGAPDNARPMIETLYEGVPDGPYATADTVRWRATEG